jgi:hypothetical protein
MRIRIIIETFIVFALGVFSIFDGIRLILGGKLRLYDVLGPGNYNMGLGSLLVIVAIIYLALNLKNIRSKNIQIIEEVKENVETYKLKVVLMIACLVLYSITLNLFGLFLSSLIFFILMLKIAGLKSWRNSLIVGFIIASAFFIVFNKWLNVFFPEGKFFHFDAIIKEFLKFG